MIHSVPSRKDPQALDAALREAAAKHKFGVLGSFDLQAKMKEKGLDFATPVTVYEVCSPAQAHRVLSSRIEASAMLPCRIAVYGTGSGCRLATMKPSELVKGFDDPELEAVADEVERDLIAIMAQAAG